MLASTAASPLLAAVVPVTLVPVYQLEQKLVTNSEPAMGLVPGGPVEPVEVQSVWELGFSRGSEGENRTETWHDLHSMYTCQNPVIIALPAFKNLKAMRRGRTAACRRQQSASTSSLAAAARSRFSGICTSECCADAGIY